jgi:hypothetical protein
MMSRREEIEAIYSMAIATGDDKVLTYRSFVALQHLVEAELPALWAVADAADDAHACGDAMCPRCEALGVALDDYHDEGGEG